MNRALKIDGRKGCQAYLNAALTSHGHFRSCPKSTLPTGSQDT